MSTMPATVVSDCPTPTVSTMITSKPAASHSSIASRVFSATPPSEPADGLGRMKASSRWHKHSMRVLSPRIEPPDTEDDGSTASTATLLALLDQPNAERFDEGGFARARDTGDADADRACRCAATAHPAPLRARLMIRPGRFDQRDRLGQRAALPASTPSIQD